MEREFNVMYFGCCDGCEKVEMVSKYNFWFLCGDCFNKHIKKKENENG